jgi:predicted dehydrogenase
MSFRVVLVGTGGYGAVHLDLLRTFARRGELRLVAAVVFQRDATLEAQLAAERCRVFATFDELMQAWPDLKADLCVLPTPLHLHVPMASTLLRAGAHVLVEKPIASTLAGADTLAQLAAEQRRTLAVGFQYLHAPEVRELKRRLLAGEIGRLERIVVRVLWPRSHAYYQRNAWAGRARVGDDWVLDSPVSNAMSHFLLLMLFLAGETADTAAVPVELKAELYRAQAIETFDTAVLRFRTASGQDLSFIGTHSSEQTVRPVITLNGTEGEAMWVQDGHASIDGKSGRWKQAAHPEAHTRERMLGDLLALLGGEPSFVCTPELATVHVRCVEALRFGGVIHEVPSAYRGLRDEAGHVFTFVRQLGDHLIAAADRGGSLRDAGAVWARPPVEVPIQTAAVSNG